MASKDLKDNLNVAQTLVPAVRNAAATGLTVDLQGYEGALFVVVAGALTDGSHSFTAQESDDDSAWSAVAAADLEGAFAALVANTPQRVGYKGAKRYVRVNGASSGVTGAAFGVAVVRGYARHLPLA